MASRSFSTVLGGSKRTDVTEAANAPSAGFIEVRVDEAISQDLDKIVQHLQQLMDYIVEAKRYV